MMAKKTVLHEWQEADGGLSESEGQWGEVPGNLSDGDEGSHI